MDGRSSKEDRASRRGRIASLLARLELRFPGLFVLLAVVLVVDLIVPDFIPFVDEIVLAILTTIFGLWKKKREDRPVSALPDDGAERAPR